MSAETFGFPEEEDVVVLGDKNFAEAIQKHKFILVEFYAPWCGHCKKLAPEYSKAAKELKGLESPVPLAKVDATENAESAKKYGVQGYPTIKFFVEGNPVDYNGGRTASDIVNWIKKKTGPPSELIKDAAALEEAKKANKVLTVYFGSEEDSEFAEYKSAALSLDAISFAHVTDAEIIAANEGSKVVVFTQHNNGAAALKGDVTKDAILSHINEHRYPPVMSFEGDEAIERVFGKENPAIVFFSDSEVDFTKTFTEIAVADKANTEKPLVFASSTVTSGLGQRLAEYIGVSASSAPTVWIIHPAQGDLQKFHYTGELTMEGVQSFISNWRQGTLDRHFKSADIPEKNDGPVKIAVGKNWGDIVVNNDKYVLVKFYAPWCGHCKSLAPIYEELAKKYAGNDKLVIAKLDSTENEVPGISIRGFPTLKLFAPGKKDTPIDFSGDRTLEGFETFLKKELGDDFVVPSTDL